MTAKVCCGFLVHRFQIVPLSQPWAAKPQSLHSSWSGSIPSVYSWIQIVFQVTNAHIKAVESKSAKQINLAGTRVITTFHLRGDFVATAHPYTELNNITYKTLNVASLFINKW